MEKIVCRRCLLEEMNDEDAKRVVRDYLETMNPNEKTEEKTYRERLQMCRECDRLINGTCLECGCYVEIRAALKKADCPHKKWSVSCNLCPRNCHADRSAGRSGFCGVDNRILVNRAALHMWEEPCISGAEGSGTVFFSGCNLHCCYCQNYDISRGTKGFEISEERLSEIFLELQEKKANNINLVTPTHYVPQIIRAISRARDNGLKLPILYNSGGYESVDTVKMLEGYIDIWMPDMKYMSGDIAQRYSKASDYFEKASEALDEMVAQMRRRALQEQMSQGSSDKESLDIDGICRFDNRGMMTRGVIVRHMTLPGCTGDSKRILRYLHEKYGDDIYISIMSQYTPMKQILVSDEFPELKRKITKEEYGRLIDFAEKIGITKAFVQNGDVAEESFIPEFDGEGVFNVYNY